MLYLEEVSFCQKKIVFQGPQVAIQVSTYNHKLQIWRREKLMALNMNPQKTIEHMKHDIYIKHLPEMTGCNSLNRVHSTFK